MTRQTKALDALLSHYVGLVDSGDAGSWDPEKEQVVIEARAALAAPAAPSEPVVMEALRTVWRPDGTVETEYKHVSNKCGPLRWELYEASQPSTMPREVK